MKNLTLILTLISCCKLIYGQSDSLYGLYENTMTAFRQLDLKPDMTYLYYHQGPCGLVPAHNDSGRFEILMDTIKLISYVSNHESKEFLIIRHRDSINANYMFWENGTLAEIFTSDTILPSNLGGRLTEYKGVYFGSYRKVKAYYDNGNVQKSKDVLGKLIIETFYFENGQVKEIRSFKKDKKHGDWMYYNPTGELEKLKRYRRDKLKKEIKNGR